MPEEDIADDNDDCESSGSINVEDLMKDIPDCICPGHRHELTVMTIADCHGMLMRKELEKALEENPCPDVVFFLGDNFACDIEAVLELLPESITQIYGITGNHDFTDALMPYRDRITDLGEDALLSQKLMLPEGVSISGLSGSIRYKQDSCYSILTNEESEQIMAEKPQCDILITYDKPCFDIPERITSHSGLTGIGKYILVKKPKLVLHGHIHDKYTKQLGDTIIRCCYRVEIFKAYL